MPAAGRLSRVNCEMTSAIVPKTSANNAVLSPNNSARRGSNVTSVARAPASARTAITIPINSSAAPMAASFSRTVRSGDPEAERSRSRAPDSSSPRVTRVTASRAQIPSIGSSTASRHVA